MGKPKLTGEILRQIREENGLSPEYVSVQLGHDRSYLRKMEKKFVRPFKEEVMLLLEFYGVDCSTFDLGNLRRKHWTETLVLQEINRAWAIGHSLNHAYAIKHLNSLRSAAEKRFGSWKNAVIAAGFDYSQIIKQEVRRGKQWYIDYLRKIYEDKGSVTWDDLDGVNFYAYFKSSKQFFDEAEIPYCEVLNKFKGWSKFGQRFERIVDIIFETLYPLYLRQFTGIDGVRPDWYDPQTNTAFDVKLGLKTVSDWPEIDTYINKFDKVIAVYFLENLNNFQSNNITVIHVSEYVSLLTNDKRHEIQQELDKLEHDIESFWNDSNGISVWIEHFGEIPKGYYVYHKDGNIYNCDIGNLELGTLYKYELSKNGCFKQQDGNWYRHCPSCQTIKIISDFPSYRNPKGSLCQCRTCHHNRWAKKNLDNLKTGDIVKYGAMNIECEFIKYIMPGDYIPSNAPRRPGKVADRVLAYIRNGDKYYTPKPQCVTKISCA